MFLLSNCDTKLDFKVSKKNNLVSLERNADGLIHRSTEFNCPANFICVKSNEESPLVFYKSDFVEAKIFKVEVVYERKEETASVGNYENLIADFGDKNSKMKIIRRNAMSYASKDVATFKITNQMLPNFDREADHPKDLYSLQLLVSNDTFTILDETELAEDGLSDYIGKIVQENGLSMDNKNIVLALDCYYRVLTAPVISKDALEGKDFFFPEVAGDVFRGKLPQLSKDKLVVKFYILLLIYMNYEARLEYLPKFGLSAAKVIDLLKVIGCTIYKNDIVKLDSLPKDSYTLKKLKK